MISAIIAARDHPEVATLLIGLMGEREKLLREVVGDAQSAGVLSKDVTAAAVSRLSMVIALGSVLAGGLGVDPIDHDEWAVLIARLVDALRP